MTLPKLPKAPKQLPRKSLRLAMEAAEAPHILHEAVVATGRSQVRLAIDIFGVNDRSLRSWLAGEPCWPPVVRLAYLLAKHPSLADELEAHFSPRED